MDGEEIGEIESEEWVAPNPSPLACAPCVPLTTFPVASNSLPVSLIKASFFFLVVVYLVRLSSLSSLYPSQLVSPLAPRRPQSVSIRLALLRSARRHVVGSSSSTIVITITRFWARWCARVPPTPSLAPIPKGQQQQ